MSYPAISLSTATADRHRRPQKRLRPPANLPSTRIRARIIAPATPSPLFPCPHALHPGPSVDSDLRYQIASRDSTTRVRPSLSRARSRTGRSRGACGKAPRWSGEPRPCPPPERDSSGRPDILIEEASGWPVVIEAKVSNHAAAEKDAKARLGRIVASTGRQIETSIALVYPPAVRSLNGAALRKAINSSNDLEYVLCTHRPGESPDRMPSRGWIRGSVRDLAVLVHRAAAPPPRIEELAKELEDGSLLDGRRRCCGRDHLQSLSQ